MTEILRDLFRQKQNDSTQKCENVGKNINIIMSLKIKQNICEIKSHDYKKKKKKEDGELQMELNVLSSQNDLGNGKSSTLYENKICQGYML